MDLTIGTLQESARAEAEFVDMAHANLLRHGKELARKFNGTGRVKAACLCRDNELNTVLDTLPPDLMSAPVIPENSRLVMAFRQRWKRRLIVQVQSLAALWLDPQFPGSSDDGIPPAVLDQRIPEVQKNYPADFYYLAFFTAFPLNPAMPLPGGYHTNRCRVLFVYPGACRGWYGYRSSSTLCEPEMDCFCRVPFQERVSACCNCLVRGFRERWTSRPGRAVLLPVNELPFPCRDPELIQKTSDRFFPSGLTMIRSPDGRLKAVRLEDFNDINFNITATG